MNQETKRHLIGINESIREALRRLNELAADAILFIVDEENKLVGSLTDGDLRRGFLKGLGFEDRLENYIQSEPKHFVENKINQKELIELRDKGFKIIPILNEKGLVVEIINFKKTSTLLPLDAVIMAGGKGMRLRPLTENTPKPLLEVGGKPIIEYNVDRLNKVGIKNLFISVNYLGEQLEDYFKDGFSKDMNISYLWEDKPLGTIGSVLLVDEFKHDEILVMNSDLLTNIDFEDFYNTFKESGADMAVAAIPYHVDIPYAVLEVNDSQEVLDLKEKPKYTYFSNAGIYLIKKEVLEMIPRGEFFDITDLMDKILAMDRKIKTYPINGYWLDIGKHEDFNKAQEDIKHLKL